MPEPTSALDWLTASTRDLAPAVLGVATPVDQLTRYHGRHRLDDLDVHLPRRQHMRPDEVEAYATGRAKVLGQLRHRRAVTSG